VTPFEFMEKLYASWD